MMKVPRAQGATADVEVASQNIEVFRAGVDVGGVADPGFEFSEEHRVTALGLEGEELDPGACDGQLLPAGSVGAGQEAEAARDTGRQRRWAGGGSSRLSLEALEHFSLEGWRRSLGRQGENHTFHGTLQGPEQFPEFGVGACLPGKLLLLPGAEQSQHIDRK